MSDDDYKMALLLQRQFNHENYTENPTNGLVYEDKKKKKKSALSSIKDPTKSLIDPSWELVDPTPDIHVLFLTFNGKFFWNQLGSVTVSWSKRMTVCAGICSYEGRGKVCKITLSEPLLKLRPRKDLIETLLHEMIHALLFITKKDRHSRDGHGPEFHKHMYRINNEAGTNISVYHDFHDEVKLYQQHWWRCNGPCQKWRPYYGFVKRSMNRAPGPNDFWWKDHQYKCGGTYIKVKEPEKPEKKKKGASEKVSGKENKNKTKNLGDITKFISNSNKKNDISTLSSITNGGNMGIKNKNGTVVLNSKTKKKMEDSNPSTKDLKNLDSTFNATKILNTKPLSNVFTIKDVDTTNTFKPNIFNAPKTPKTSTKTSETSTLSSPNIEDYSVVRNKWLEKFNQTSTFQNDEKTKKSSSRKSVSDLLNVPESSKKDSGSKRKSKSVSDISNTPNKKLNIESGAIEKYLDKSEVMCPVCQKLIKKDKINDHLDKCLASGGLGSEETEEPGTIDSWDDSFEEMKDNVVKITCPVCKKSVNDAEMDAHLDRCLNGDNANSGHKIKIEPSTSFKNKQPSSSINQVFVQCEICDNFLPSDTLDLHMEKCLHKLYDEIEAKYNLSSTRSDLTNCLVCNKSIKRTELNQHLDSCMGTAFQGNLHDDLDYKDEDEVTEEKEDLEKKYNCPICLQLVEESVMNKHIDICLNDNNLVFSN